MCKSCYNCEHFNQNNPVFVSCNKLDDDDFTIHLETSIDNDIENFDSFEEWLDADVKDVDCEHWKDIDEEY